MRPREQAIYDAVVCGLVGAALGAVAELCCVTMEIG